MVAGNIARHAVFHPVAKQPFCRPSETMMKEAELRETGCLPSQHVCFDLINRVPTRGRPQAADCLPAGPSIDLCRSTDVKSWIGLELHLARQAVVVFTATNSKLRFFVELAETFLEVVRRERQVAVQLHYEFPVFIAEGVVTCMKRLHHAAAGFAIASIGTVDNCHPWNLGRIPIDDSARAVGRTVIDDHPLRWQAGLVYDRSDGGFEVLFFVTHRSDDHVSRHSTASVAQRRAIPRYSRRPSCHFLNTFRPAVFRARFSSTEYLGLGTLAGNSSGEATFRFTRVSVRSNISRANSYQEQLPSDVAW